MSDTPTTPTLSNWSSDAEIHSDTLTPEEVYDVIEFLTLAGEGTNQPNPDDL